MADAKKRLKNIEAHVLPSFFIGVLLQDDTWMKKTIDKLLPELEAKALRLAEQCKKEGDCEPDDPLCDENRISHYPAIELRGINGRVHMGSYSLLSLYIYQKEGHGES